MKNTLSWNITSQHRNQRILLVDDSADSLRLLQVTLKLKGYNTIIADSGAEALLKIAESPPDLVLLDVVMPDMDGYEGEQCENVRSDFISQLPGLIPNKPRSKFLVFAFSK
ncbi:response regulator [Nostoc sp.]|uniref:response regulator n=1 Tax=Nostoc sp. TaxID=1180 RepID=UPI002FFAC93C